MSDEKKGPGVKKASAKKTVEPAPVAKKRNFTRELIAAKLGEERAAKVVK